MGNLYTGNTGASHYQMVSQTIESFWHDETQLHHCDAFLSATSQTQH